MIICNQSKLQISSRVIVRQPLKNGRICFNKKAGTQFRLWFHPVFRALSSKDGLLRFCLFLFLYGPPVLLILAQFYVGYGFLRQGSPLYGALRGSIFAVIACEPFCSWFLRGFWDLYRCAVIEKIVSGAPKLAFR